MFIDLTECCARFTKTATQLKSHFREMEEISIFVKDAICNDQCLGRCLYIHGVPGTGKVRLSFCGAFMVLSHLPWLNIKPIFLHLFCQPTDYECTCGYEEAEI
jgi:hypothetical protein